MTNWCLTKDQVDKFLQGLRTGEINPEKMADMGSVDRRNYIAKFVGEANAREINALFESKLLLKNQKAGMVRWAKKVMGVTPTTRRDIIARIEKLDKVLDPEEADQFLQDLASTKLGVEVTQEEAKVIVDLSKKVRVARDKLTDDTPNDSKESFEYGLAGEMLKDYMTDLKRRATKVSFREQPVKYVTKLLWNFIPDTAQTLETAFDESLYGRQLIGVLMNPRYSRIWIKSFNKSQGEIVKVLMGEDPLLAIRASVRGRVNARNGKYAADPEGYGLGIESEELYSVRWPARIPALGRLFKAGEVAFNGGALRVRADLADLHIKAAESAGFNVLDREFAKGLGNFVTTITGRAAVAKEGWLRTLFYAPRLYTAIIHRLTFHLFDPKANAYTKKEAAKNLLLRLGSYALLFVTAKIVNEESVDFEKHLGQIKIAGGWVDFSGGEVGFVNLAAKMAQKVYAYSQGRLPKYGEPTALDLLENFAENKLSPKASVIKDILVGRMYGGKPVTLTGELKSRFTPLTAQDVERLLEDPKSTNDLALGILSGLGLTVRTQTPFQKDWSVTPTKLQRQFLETVGKTKFEQANKRWNQEYDAWFEKVSQTQAYKKLSDDARQNLTNNAKEKIQQRIFRDYGFTKKEATQTPAEKAESKSAKELLPE